MGISQRQYKAYLPIVKVAVALSSSQCERLRPEVNMCASVPTIIEACACSTMDTAGQPFHSGDALASLLVRVNHSFMHAAGSGFSSMNTTVAAVPESRAVLCVLLG
eukprot:1157308-Pelagomonas_calceolata.AAC.12